jgi:hypothetical protein
MAVPVICIDAAEAGLLDGDEGALANAAPAAMKSEMPIAVMPAVRLVNKIRLFMFESSAQKASAGDATIQQFGDDDAHYGKATSLQRPCGKAQ